MKLGPLNHVGVAVPDLDAAVRTYREMFDVTDISDLIELPEQGVSVRFVNLPTGQVELISPLGEASPIVNFLKKNPKGGQHHLCFEVDNIHDAMKEMEKRGATVLNKPRIGAHGTPVIFVHPKDFQGVLIELMETPKGAH